jgi:hypothetical protein
MPAQGARKLIVPWGLTFSHHFGTVPFGLSGVNGFSVFSGGLTWASNLGTSAFLGRAGQDSFYQLRLGLAPQGTGWTAGDSGLPLNISLQGTANPTAGDGHVTLTILYELVDL